MEEEKYTKKKSTAYFISFAFMFILSLVETFLLGKSMIKYLTGSVGIKIISSVLIISSFALMAIFTFLLAFHFFKSKTKSLSVNITKMLIIGIVATITALLANFTSGSIIVNRTVFILGVIISVIYLIHLFFIREFNYIPNDDSEMENEDYEIKDDEEDVDFDDNRKHLTGVVEKEPKHMAKADETDIDDKDEEEQEDEEKQSSKENSQNEPVENQKENSQEDNDDEDYL